MQAGQCSSQMSTKFLGVVCGENGIGGGGGYCGGNDAQLDRINVFYHEAWAALFDFETSRSRPGKPIAVWLWLPPLAPTFSSGEPVKLIVLAAVWSGPVADGGSCFRFRWPVVNFSQSSSKADFLLGSGFFGHILGFYVEKP